MTFLTFQAWGLECVEELFSPSFCGNTLETQLYSTMYTLKCNRQVGINYYAVQYLQALDCSFKGKILPIFDEKYHWWILLTNRTTTTPHHSQLHTSRCLKVSGPWTSWYYSHYYRMESDTLNSITNILFYTANQASHCMNSCQKTSVSPKIGRFKRTSTSLHLPRMSCRSNGTCCLRLF